jgi:hypothetical protein
MSAARRRAPARPARRPAGRTARRRARKGKSGAAARPVERARRALDQATETVRAAAAALAGVADQIAAEAREAEHARLASELAAEQVLRDVAKLQRAFTVAPDGALPADIEVLRKLPDAILAWARQRLGVTPHLAVGQELEVPADRLSAFMLDGTLPPAGRGIVRIRVLAPGWKRAGRILVAPRALIL